MNDKLEELKLAEKIAREAHKNQTRWDGSPYIKHPERIAFKFDSIDCRIIAWLHDVIEDTDYTADDLRKAGISENCVQAVEILSRPEDMDYYRYIMRMKRDKFICEIKIADITDNLNDGIEDEHNKNKHKIAKYKLARELLSRFWGINNKK